MFSAVYPQRTSLNRSASPFGARNGLMHTSERAERSRGSEMLKVAAQQRFHLCCEKPGVFAPRRDIDFPVCTRGKLSAWDQPVLPNREAGSQPSTRRSFCPYPYLRLSKAVMKPGIDTRIGKLRRCNPGAGSIYALRPAQWGWSAKTSPNSSPTMFRRTVEHPAAETMQCAQGYSGCIGVSPSGNHNSSPGVAAFCVISALRIAVIGRQKL